MIPSWVLASLMFFGVLTLLILAIWLVGVMLMERRRLRARNRAMRGAVVDLSRERRNRELRDLQLLNGRRR